jgi:AcrR family transcriptional regulator
MTDHASLPTSELSESDAELLARRREIGKAGIAIADEQGIDAVSMRNIATRLGVGTMTLYTWVENKEDLVAVMADALADQMLVPEPMPEDWREALTQIAVATRDVFNSHPWMITGSRPPGRLGANMLRHIDQSLRAVKGLDIDWEMRSSILQAVDHYALGYAVANQRHKERAEAHRARDAVNDPDNYGAAFNKVSEARAHKARVEAVATRGDAAAAIELRAMFESGGAPALSEIFGTPEQALERIRQGPPQIQGDFDDGLRWMLDGIAAMLDERNAR